VLYFGILVILVITIITICLKMFNFKNNRIQEGKMNSIISAREIVDQFHISYQTVNHYTDFGLLQIVFKQGNVRYYNKNEVKSRLAKISRLAREGYSLRLIRRKLIGL
jgi:hypothetical protein